MFVVSFEQQTPRLHQDLHQFYPSNIAIESCALSVLKCATTSGFSLPIIAQMYVGDILQQTLRLHQAQAYTINDISFTT